MGFSTYSQDEITFETTFFSEIKVFDAITVNLIQSNENKAIIFGDDKEKVVVVNNNGRLKIRMKIDKMHSGKNTHVDVYYSKVLDLIDANEGAFISSLDTIKQTHVQLRAQEGAEIDLNVDVKKLDIRAITGGKVEVKGEAVNQEANISAGGEFNAIQLINEQSKITITTGGYAYVNTSEYIDAKVKIGGTIKIYGNTKVVKKTTFLGGIILEL